MHLGDHVGLRFGSALEQQVLHGWVIPGIAKRPSGGVDIRIRVGSAVKQQFCDWQIACQGRVPQRHPPGLGRLFEFLKENAFVHIGSQIEQELSHCKLAMIYSEGKESTATANLAEKIGLGLDELSNARTVSEGDGSANGEVRAMLEQQGCDTGKVFCAVITRVGGKRSMIERREAIRVLLANVRTPGQEP